MQTTSITDKQQVPKITRMTTIPQRRNCGTWADTVILHSRRAVDRWALPVLPRPVGYGSRITVLPSQTPPLSVIHRPLSRTLADIAVIH